MKGYVSLEYIRRMLNNFAWDVQRSKYKTSVEDVKHEIQHYRYVISKQNIQNKEKYGNENESPKGEITMNTDNLFIPLIAVKNELNSLKVSLNTRSYLASLTKREHQLLNEEINCTVRRMCERTPALAFAKKHPKDKYLGAYFQGFADASKVLNNKINHKGDN